MSWEKEIGEPRRREELARHMGAVDDEAASEDEAFERTAKFLSYLPNSVHDLAARASCDDDPQRADPWLIEAVPRDPRKVYNMRRIIAAAHAGPQFFRRSSLILRRRSEAA